MLETILGGVLGGLSRLAPEVFAMINRKADQKHELDMLAANLEADKARLAGQLAVTNAQAQSQDFSAALEALKESVKAQASETGIKWVDAINLLVRPSVTYIVFLMWTLVKIASLATVITHFQTLEQFSSTLNDWWVPNDQAMLMAILNFWFMGRVFDKALK